MMSFSTPGYLREILDPIMLPRYFIEQHDCVKNLVFARAQIYNFSPCAVKYSNISSSCVKLDTIARPARWLMMLADLIAASLDCRFIFKGQTRAAANLYFIGERVAVFWCAELFNVIRGALKDIRSTYLQNNNELPEKYKSANLVCENWIWSVYQKTHCIPKYSVSRYVLRYGQQQWPNEKLVTRGLCQRVKISAVA